MKPAPRLARHTGLTLLLSLCAAANAGPKVWEHDNGEQRMVNGVSLEMLKSTNRDAPLHGFVAQAVNLRTGVDAMFKGACAELVNVEIQFRDTRKVDLGPFLASRAGKDLPVKDVLNVMQQALAEQCDQLQVIRLGVRATHAHQADFQYEGTLQKAQGWKLMDGRQATAYDNSMQFEIRLRDMQSAAGIRFRGRCEAEPTLMLEPMYSSESERAMSRRLDVLDYLPVAKNVSVEYARHCPETRRIRYALNPLPRAYRCKAAGDCFLIATRGAEWAVDAEQIVRKEVNNPIVDIDDGTEVLAAGRFDILADYNDYFSYYVIAWFAGYSDNCKASIRNPVTRRYQFVKQTTDGNGNVISEEFSEPVEIHIERDHQGVFDAHWAGYQQYMFARMFKATVGATQRGYGVNTVTMRMYDLATEGARQMRAFLADKCAAPRTLTVQDNLLRYASQQSPVTGKYATNKKPRVVLSDNGSSAPGFTDKYVRERAQQDKAAEDARVQASKATRAGAAKPASTAPATTPEPVASASSASNPPRAGSAETNARTLEALAQEHQRQVAQAAQEYQAQARSARTPEDRRALQQSYQTKQRALQEAYQAKVKELIGR